MDDYELDDLQEGSGFLDYEVDSNFEPTEEEIIEYAKYLGMDPDRDQKYFYIAKQGLKCPLPEPWRMYRNSTGEIFFVNQETEDYLQENPKDFLFQQKFLEEKRLAGEIEFEDTDEPHEDDYNHQNELEEVMDLDLEDLDNDKGLNKNERKNGGNVNENQGNDVKAGVRRSPRSYVPAHTAAGGGVNEKQNKLKSNNNHHEINQEKVADELEAEYYDEQKPRTKKNKNDDEISKKSKFAEQIHADARIYESENFEANESDTSVKVGGESSAGPDEMSHLSFSALDHIESIPVDRKYVKKNSESQVFSHAGESSGKTSTAVAGMNQALQKLAPNIFQSEQIAYSEPFHISEQIESNEIHDLREKEADLPKQQLRGRENRKWSDTLKEDQVSDLNITGKVKSDNDAERQPQAVKEPGGKKNEMDSQNNRLSAIPVSESIVTESDLRKPGLSNSNRLNPPPSLQKVPSNFKPGNKNDFIAEEPGSGSPLFNKGRKKDILIEEAPNQQQIKVPRELSPQRVAVALEGMMKNENTRQGNNIKNPEEIGTLSILSSSSKQKLPIKTEVEEKFQVFDKRKLDLKYLVEEQELEFLDSKSNTESGFSIITKKTMKMNEEFLANEQIYNDKLATIDSNIASKLSDYSDQKSKDLKQNKQIFNEKLKALTNKYEEDLRDFRNDSLKQIKIANNEYAKEKKTRYERAKKNILKKSEQDFIFTVNNIKREYEEELKKREAEFDKSLSKNIEEEESLMKVEYTRKKKALTMTASYMLSALRNTGSNLLKSEKIQTLEGEAERFKRKVEKVYEKQLKEFKEKQETLKWQEHKKLKEQLNQEILEKIKEIRVSDRLLENGKEEMKNNLRKIIETKLKIEKHVLEEEFTNEEFKIKKNSFDQINKLGNLQPEKDDVKSIGIEQKKRDVDKFRNNFHQFVKEAEEQEFSKYEGKRLEEIERILNTKISERRRDLKNVVLGIQKLRTEIKASKERFLNMGLPYKNLEKSAASSLGHHISLKNFSTNQNSPKLMIRDLLSNKSSEMKYMVFPATEGKNIALTYETEEVKSWENYIIAESRQLQEDNYHFENLKDSRYRTNSYRGGVEHNLQGQDNPLMLKIGEKSLKRKKKALGQLEAALNHMKKFQNFNFSLLKSYKKKYENSGEIDATDIEHIKNKLQRKILLGSSTKDNIKKNQTPVHNNLLSKKPFSLKSQEDINMPSEAKEHASEVQINEEYDRMLGGTRSSMKSRKERLLNVFTTHTSFYNDIKLQLNTMTTTQSTKGNTTKSFRNFL